MHKRWTAWGVSVAGPGHKKNGLPNQDTWLFRSFKNGTAVAVSDGLGSKPFSDRGSMAACRSVLDAARIFHRHSHGDFKMLPQLIHALWLLKLGGNKPIECAATCLFAMQADKKIIFGRLGDGLILGFGKDRHFIMEDTKDEFFSNVTNCLTGGFAAEEWEIVEVSVEDCDAVILCTDGVANDIVTDRRVDFAKSLYLEYKNMDRGKRSREIARWLSNWPVPGHSDDKTLVCLYREDSENV